MLPDLSTWGCEVLLLVVDVTDGVGALVESGARGGPAVVCRVERASEVGQREALEDGDAFWALVGGLGDFVPGDSAEGVLCSEKCEKARCTGAQRVCVGEPVGSAAGHVGLVLVTGDHEGRGCQFREGRVHEGGFDEASQATATAQTLKPKDIFRHGRQQGLRRARPRMTR